MDTTTQETTALAPTQKEQSMPQIAVGETGLQLTTFDDMWRMATAMAASELVPKDYKGKPANALIAMQYGAELGFKPMQALQSISVINGRPGLGGDAALAKVRSIKVGSQNLLEDFKKEIIGTPGTDSYGYRVTVKRLGMSPQSEEFTVAKAKVAGLWGKEGPWKNYPDRQLYYRPLGFVLRDQFSDVLKGLFITEELEDFPQETNLPPKTTGPKFDSEAIAASNGTANMPSTTEKSEPVKTEEAQFQDVPAKPETSEAKPEVKLSPKDAQLQAEFETQFPK